MDPFVECLQKNDEVLSKLTDKQVVMLALSELMAEMSIGKDIPPGTKAKRMSLSAQLVGRAGVGVKW